MYRLLSWLMQYPDDAILGQLAAIREAAGPAGGPPGPAAKPAEKDQPVGALSAATRARDALLRFVAWMEDQSPGALRILYTDTFDFSSETSLYLTYHLYGDLRERGQVLADLKSWYREAGYAVEGEELPDYLPLVLELTAEAPEFGLPVLREYRAPIESIRRRLAGANHPYGLLMEALSLSLPASEPEVNSQMLPL